MNKAFVDTTILVDALLKSKIQRKITKAALERYLKTELPMYAIKEFKAGALNNFIWIHNKLAQFKSYSKALEMLQRMSLTPKRYTTSTAIEALTQASSSIAHYTPQDLQNKYGLTNIDQILAEECRLQIKIKIFNAWNKRKSITTDVVLPLSCYHEALPTINNNMIEVKPIKCEKGEDCCLKSKMVNSINDLKKLKKAIEGGDKKPENDRRLKALNELIKNPKRDLTDDNCRNLGDLIFAFFAPSDAKILTTNRRDFQGLAEALSKSVDTPND